MCKRLSQVAFLHRFIEVGRATIRCGWQSSGKKAPNLRALTGPRTDRPKTLCPTPPSPKHSPLHDSKQHTTHPTMKPHTCPQAKAHRLAGTQICANQTSSSILLNVVENGNTYKRNHLQHAPSGKLYLANRVGGHGACSPL